MDSGPAVAGIFATRYLSGEFNSVLNCAALSWRSSVAGLIVLLWDHCLTFEQERQLIWFSRPSFVKLAFLSNRYIVPVVLIVDAYSVLCYHRVHGVHSRLNELNPALSGLNSWGLTRNVRNFNILQSHRSLTFSTVVREYVYSFLLDCNSPH
jgi:hypothetical protein